MSEVKKELLFLGELRKPTGGDQEWFPPFCYELIEKMSENYKIKILDCEAIQEAVQYEKEEIEYLKSELSELKEMMKKLLKK